MEEDEAAYKAARCFALNCSAEPLTREGIVARLKELAAWGVDLSLVEATLEETPTERLLRNAALSEFVSAARIVNS